MDPQLSLYLERTIDVLVTAGAEALETEFEELDETEAVLDATIRFTQGYRLETAMVVSVSENEPMRAAYSFHFMDGSDTTVFRYDNARHHHDLDHFPHHKHIGADERVVGCPQPSVGQIRDEIAAYLNGEA